MTAEKFNTYRLPEAGCFAEYKEKVMDLLASDDGERGGRDGGGVGDGEGGCLVQCLGQ